jgi:hypothetical protein
MNTVSNKFEDKDIEKIIFRDRLTSSEIEPSEKFWNKAYESIVQREGRANAIRSKRWRIAFLMMGTIIVLLGSYTTYMHQEVNNIKQQLLQIESTRITIPQQDSTQSSTLKSIDKSTENDLSNTNEEAKNIQGSKALTSCSSVNSSSSILSAKNQSGRNYSRLSTPSFKISVTSQPVLMNTTPAMNVNIPIATGNPSPIEIKGNSSQNANETATQQITSTTAPTPTVINSSKLQTSKNDSLIQIENTKLAIKRADSLKKEDSASGSSVFVPKKQITLAGILSKMSVSVFYAPGLNDDFLDDKENDPTNTITANVLNTEQDGYGAYATGLRLGFDVSDKITIQTGCSYRLYSYSIDPTTIYAQKQETGQLGYSLPTSSGTIFLPYSNGVIHSGDSLDIEGSSSRGYISIPLQFKYKLLAGTVLGFYVTGGFSANFSVYKETLINWENTGLQQGDIVVQSIYGLSNVQYTYNIGFGANYLINNGLSLFIEPYMDASITAINKNTPVIIYPYFFGIALGVTYHF